MRQRQADVSREILSGLVTAPLDKVYPKGSTSPLDTVYSTGSTSTLVRVTAELGRRSYPPEARADGCYGMLTPQGSTPTGISLMTASVAVSMTLTLFDRPLAT